MVDGLIREFSWKRLIFQLHACTVLSTSVFILTKQVLLKENIDSFYIYIYIYIYSAIILTTNYPNE